MNIIQASILNNFCNIKTNALLVITQANNSLSVYYTNAKGNIAHMFSKCERNNELEAGLVWVSLSNYLDNYKKLLKYFHPDYYKGKRTTNELSKIISILVAVKRFNKDVGVRTVNDCFIQVDNRPRNELSNEEYLNFSVFQLLGTRNWFKQLQDWVESYRYLQDRHYSQQWSYQYF